MKKLLFLAPVALLVTLSGTAYAAEKVCDLNEQYKAFTFAAQNSSYSPEDIRKELSARGALLSAAIDCAKADITDLRNQVLPDDTDPAKQAKERVVESLDSALRFYDSKKNSIRDMGIQGTKDLAREIKNWRDANYGQLSGRVQNFIFWSSNQKLFDKASDRLSQSQIVVASLRVLNNEDFQKVYYDAKSGLENAEELNRRAGEAIADNVSAEEVFGLIKDSLVALSDTYKNFLEISGKLNTSPAPEEGTSTDSNSK